MSHYTKCKTSISDKDCLVRALEDLGFKGKLEVHDTPQNLFGYQGDMRKDTAEIVIRRQHVGGASNDIGFKLQEDGTYGGVISEYDNSIGYNGDWLKKLNKRYNYHKVTDSLAEQGFIIDEENVDEFGNITLECSGGFA